MGYTFADRGERRRVLRQVRRVVLKVGTRLLTDMGPTPIAERVRELMAAVHGLRTRGYDILLVSSGAIGAGMTVLETAKRPRSMPNLQAHAAVGQCRLMHLYETASAEHGFHCGQLLLTAADIQNRERYLNVASCLDALLANGVLPVINENDSVSVEEIRVGDNDMLAALVASMLRADVTVLLTTVDGMREPSPDGALGARLSVVHEIDAAVRAMAGGTDGNRFSIGGMATKLRAAEVVTKAGENLFIADGTDFGTLGRLFAAEDVGTLFCARSGSRRMACHKRFLAFFSEPSGEVTVDDGAGEALCRRGRSLLPRGVIGISGVFGRGDTVRILDRSGVELARGVTNYGHEELARIQGVRSADIPGILGQEACYEEVVHRNCLALTR